MASASEDAISKLVGVYEFQHPKGSFIVHLRTKGRFFAPKYQAIGATWNITEVGELSISWGKYGNYEMEIKDPSTRYFEGNAVGDKANWRKMKLARPFSTAEMQLMDSEWMLEHPGGSFPVEFRADGFNHFICNQFPAHSHWRLENDESPTPTLNINWGKFGEYELVLAADGQTMAGSAKGQPDNWRRATRIKALADVEEAHVHDH